MARLCPSCGVDQGVGTPGCPDCERRASEPGQYGATALGPRSPWASGLGSGSLLVAGVGLLAVLGLGGWLVHGLLTHLSPDYPAATTSNATPRADGANGSGGSGSEPSGSQAETDVQTPQAGSADRLVPLPRPRVSAARTAKPGRDGNRQIVRYDAENTTDGDLTTAWRAPGDGTGLSLSYSFPRSVRLRQVGLVPGYAKVDPKDGTDRFWEERRITAVRWTFDDGTSVSQTVDDRPALHLVDVDATTRTVTLTIEGTTAPGGDRDYTAISEVGFEGGLP
jgi:hypothetical protein